MMVQKRTINPLNIKTMVGLVLIFIDTGMDTTKCFQNLKLLVRFFTSGLRMQVHEHTKAEVSVSKRGVKKDSKDF